MSKEHCCCRRIHVRTRALRIGYLLLIFGIIGLLTSVAKGNVIGIVSNILFVISGGCIVYADKSHKPGGYLPFLIFAAIGIVIHTIIIVYFVIMVIAVPGTYSNYTMEYYGYKQTHHKDSGIYPKKAKRVNFFWIGTAVMAFADGIAIWFWTVVYRAYQHMKGVEEYDLGQNYPSKLNDV